MQGCGVGGSLHTSAHSTPTLGTWRRGGGKDRSLFASLGLKCNLFFCGFCGFSIAVLRMAGVQKPCLKTGNCGPLPLPVSSLTAGVPLPGVGFLRESAGRTAQGIHPPQQNSWTLLGYIGHCTVASPSYPQASLQPRNMLPAGTPDFKGQFSRSASLD